MKTEACHFCMHRIKTNTHHVWLNAREHSKVVEDCCFQMQQEREKNSKRGNKLFFEESKDAKLVSLVSKFYKEKEVISHLLISTSNKNSIPKGCLHHF